MNSKVRVTVLLVLFLLAFLAIAIYFMNRGGGTFDVRNRASVSTGTATMILQTGSVTHYPNDTFKVDVMLNTAGHKVSAAGFRLFFDYVPASPVLGVIDMDTARAGVQITGYASELGNGAVVSEQTNSAQTQTNGKIFIDYAVITTDINGFDTTTSGQKLATITISAKKIGAIRIEHDPAASRITSKDSASSGLDILRTIDPMDITVVADAQKPTIAVVRAPTEASTSTSPTVLFEWLGTEKPDRPADTTTPLVYLYIIDAINSANTPVTSLTRIFAHGTHTFRVRAQDANGNIGDFSPLRTFIINLTPVITENPDPAGGESGTQVTIKGFNFTNTRGIVYFGTIAAPLVNIVSWTDTQIVVKVPVGAGNNIKVKAGVLTSNVMPFVVGTSLTIRFTLQGINTDRGDKTVSVAVKKGAAGTVAQIFSTVVASWDATKNAYKVFLGPFATAPVTGADYTVSIKESSRLRKKFSAVTLTRGASNTLEKLLPADTLQVADFDNDNRMDLVDFGMISSAFTALTRPVTDATRKYDLNSDGNITIDDLSILLQNFTALVKTGEPE